ncbi:MAG: hypothetical protein K9L85_02775 [Candidatus Peribacteraceae bacterium]|nr:hypothetical protein [Candidatus Peribacteraceae bacterium]
MLFKYSQQQFADGGGMSLPLIPVTFRSKKHSIPTFALIDSGADVPILPIEIAGELGLKLNSKEKIEMNAAGGNKFYVYPSPEKVECVIEQKGFRSIVLRSPVYFAESASTILLGHNNILYQLRIVLDGAKKEVSVN